MTGAVKVTPIHPCQQPKCKRSARQRVGSVDQQHVAFEVCDAHVDWAKQQLRNAGVW